MYMYIHTYICICMYIYTHTQILLHCCVCKFQHPTHLHGTYLRSRASESLMRSTAWWCVYFSAPYTSAWHRCVCCVSDCLTRSI